MQVSDADILDVVRKLRQYTNSLDNVHWLIAKIEAINDPQLSALANKVMLQVDEAGAQAANLLKHVEGNKTYRDIVKKYRAPSAQGGDDESQDDADSN
jgi:hypothetical protein